MWMLYADRLAGDKTEYAGRRAGRGYSAVLTGLTVARSPAHASAPHSYCARLIVG